MAEHWISARDATRIFSDTDALCGRLAGKMVRFRARRVTVDGEAADLASLSEEFWSNGGRERLKQDWNAGDFISCFDGFTQTRAFGVEFQAQDILELLPIEERPAAALSLSVSGNPAWIPALATRRFAYEKAGFPPSIAGDVVVEQCRLGFIVARAVEMRWHAGQKPDDWSQEAREWDVPMWFWESFTAEGASSQNWEQGTFAGRGRGPGGYGWMTLNGVHFLGSSLECLVPRAVSIEVGDEQADPRMPALSEAALLRWWEKLTPVREMLTQEQLRALAANDHPQHTVSRDRIRALAEGRKPGPRSN